jgi:mannose-6-phosphate isomerase-like protein (cupin superfamily)
MFKSNLPSGWDLNKHYSPVLSAHDKKVRSDKVKQIAAERDNEYYEKLHAGIANRDNTYQAEANARPEVQEKISASLKGKKKTDEHNAKVAAKNKERAKSIMTPWGLYESRRAAIRGGKEQGIINPGGKIDAAIRKQSKEIFYLD